MIRVSPIYFTLFFLAMALFVDVASAQQAELNLQVVQLAGQNIYLGGGRSAGLAAGDTLWVYQENGEQPMGRLVVISVSSQYAITRFVGNPFSVTRGQTLRLRHAGEETPSPQAREQEQKSAEVKRPSIFDQRGAPPGRRSEVEPGPELHGSFSLGFYGMHSTTQFNRYISKKVNRMYLNPNAGLRLRTRNFPYHLEANVSARWTYRYADPTAINPEHVIRIYRLEVEKQFGKQPVFLKAGRFYNRYDSFSGFWDGLQLRLGDNNRGVGAIMGYEPDRADEGFSADLPKYTIFGYYELRAGKLWSETEAAWNRINPSVSWPDHRFAGLHQRFRLGSGRLDTEIQLDDLPGTKQNWQATELQLRMRLPLTRQWSINGSWRRRRPYRIWRGASAVGYERTTLDAGVAYRTQTGTLGAGLTRSSSDISQDAWAYHGYARVNKIGIWQLSAHSSVYYWTMDQSNSISASLGVDRSFGHSTIQLGYRFYHSELNNDAQSVHGLNGSWFYTIRQSWRLNIQLNGDYGTYLQRQSLSLGLFKSF